GGLRFGLELLGQLLVFGDGNAFLLHSPLVVAVDAVKSPVNEHAKLGGVPPLLPPLAIGDDLRTLLGFRWRARGFRLFRLGLAARQTSGRHGRGAHSEPLQRLSSRHAASRFHFSSAIRSDWLGWGAPAR